MTLQEPVTEILESALRESEDDAEKADSRLGECMRPMYIRESQPGLEIAVLVHMTDAQLGVHYREWIATRGEQYALMLEAAFADGYRQAAEDALTAVQAHLKGLN